MYNITFKQIETFLVIARYLNLSKAADALYLTQSSLSRILKRFEEDVGIRLFARSNQGLQLTDEGKELYAALEPLYKAMDHNIQSVRNKLNSSKKVLRIIESTTYDFAEEFFPLREIVREYESLYPDVVIDEYLCDYAELRQLIKFDNVDLIFTEDFGVRDMEDITLRRLYRMGMYIGISAKHPLAQSERLDLRALSNEKVFTIPTTASRQTDIETQLDACRHIGFSPKSVEFKPNFQTINHSVGLGKGISVSVKVTGLGHGVRFYPVELPLMPHGSVAWPKGKISCEAKKIIDMLPKADI